MSHENKICRKLMWMVNTRSLCFHLQTRWSRIIYKYDFVTTNCCFDVTTCYIRKWHILIHISWKNYHTVLPDISFFNFSGNSRTPSTCKWIRHLQTLYFGSSFINLQSALLTVHKYKLNIPLPGVLFIF